MAGGRGGTVGQKTKIKDVHSKKLFLLFFFIIFLILGLNIPSIAKKHAIFTYLMIFSLKNFPIKIFYGCRKLLVGCRMA